MGKLIIDEVIQLLKAEGIRAAAAYPTESIRRVTEPVAAVSLNRADLQARTAEVLVEILAPKENGGYLCQKTALEVCGILEDAGAVCCQGNCEFVSRSNLFRVPIKAVFSGTARYNDWEELPKYTVVTGSFTHNYVCGFSARQTPGSAGASLENAPWEITVEEFFPWGIEDSLELEEPFTMDFRCAGNIERFQNCTWTERKRVAEELGIRQTRKAKASERILTS